MLPPIRQLTSESTGLGFFVCTQKELRPGRNGEFLSLILQDATGRIVARVFDDVDRLKGEFEAGEFVKVRARANLYNERLQLIVENIRRVHPEQDRQDGFREEDCVIASARPVDEMWAELQGRIAAVANPYVKRLLEHIVAANEAKLRVWPAAQTLHHAYRAGFLEHVLQMANVGELVAKAYQADADLVLAGARPARHRQAAGTRLRPGDELLARWPAASATSCSARRSCATRPRPSRDSRRRC